MKKKIMALLFITMALSSTTYAQKNSKNILSSNTIHEIEEYLKNAHPDDPKRLVLKPKLIALKNEEWTKGKYNAKPMEARLLETSLIQNRINLAETEEFNRLISSTPQEHKNKTVKLLNAMFNEDISSKNVILLLKNQTTCNLVLRVQGKDNYNMAIPAKGENFIIINKGSYNLISNVCNKPYSSKKDIIKGTLLTISDKKEKIERL